MQRQVAIKMKIIRYCQSIFINNFVTALFKFTRTKEGAEGILQQQNANGSMDNIF
jgi:hypothetical protein